MSKRIQRYLQGEDIPDNGKFLYSKTLEEDIRNADCDCPGQLSCSCYECDIVTYFFYEVPADEI